jgi:hypothetical protein
MAAVLTGILMMATITTRMILIMMVILPVDLGQGRVGVEDWYGMEGYAHCKAYTVRPSLLYFKHERFKRRTANVECSMYIRR